MVAEFLLASLGLVILLLAGDVLVRGAVNLSLRLGIPALIVSLTIVAFGTSAPELLIAVRAVIDGVPGLALGNVVGSNTANVLLVLGVPAIIAGLDSGSSDTRRSYLMMMGGSLLFIALAAFGVLTFWHGAILFVAMLIVLIDQSMQARRHLNGNGGEDDLVEEADPSMRWWKICVYLLLGLIGLPIGAELLVQSSVEIARAFGVTETVIGLTLVAVGTSLPELATTVMAALRRHTEVAIGNVIGSNLFNLLAIMGVAAMVGPIPVEPSFFKFDLWVMLAASLLLAPFVFRQMRIGRTIGIVFVLLYAGYICALLGWSGGA